MTTEEALQALSSGQLVRTRVRPDINFPERGSIGRISAVYPDARHPTLANLDIQKNSSCYFVEELELVAAPDEWEGELELL